MRKPRETWGYVWRCRYCGKPCRGYTPRQGDGSVQVLNRHINQKGDGCENNRCDYYFDAADFMEPDKAPLAGPGN